MEGWWDCTAVDESITRLHRANLPDLDRKSWRYKASILRARWFNLQSPARAVEVGERFGRMWRY